MGDTSPLLFVDRRVAKRDGSTGVWHCGTVRYLGQVNGTRGQWVGVEWDEIDCGRHSGCYQGNNYFTVNHSGAGSFVRESKLNAGRSFREAVENKLGMGVDSEDLCDGHKIVIKSTNRDKGSIKEMSHIKHLLLIGYLINGVHDMEFLRNFSGLFSLNVANNLLPSWNEIAKITAEIPTLKSLDVSRNRLSLTPLPVDAVIKEAFRNVTALAANKIDQNWQDMIQISYMFPELRELSFCGNNVLRIPLQPDNFMRHLSTLYLDDNKIACWKEVCNLASLPVLTKLFVNNCGLTSLKLNDKECVMVFPKLDTLAIADNKLREWGDINELGTRFPKISYLAITTGFLVTNHMSPRLVRMEMVARLAGLTMLNRCAVTARERVESERWYRGNYAEEWVESGGGVHSENRPNPTHKFQVAHPRFTDVIAIHGPPHPSPSGRRTLKQSLVDVKLVYNIGRMKPDNVKIKKLSLATTVGKLKKIIERMFNIEPRKQKLSCFSPIDGISVAMDKDCRMLYFFNVRNKSTIVIEEIGQTYRSNRFSFSPVS